MSFSCIFCSQLQIKSFVKQRKLFSYPESFSALPTHSRDDLKNYF